MRSSGLEAVSTGGSTSSIVERGSFTEETRVPMATHRKQRKTQSQVESNTMLGQTVEFDILRCPVSGAISRIVGWVKATERGVWPPVCYCNGEKHELVVTGETEMLPRFSTQEAM
jgi:hypothetical protein